MTDPTFHDLIAEIRAVAGLTVGPLRARYQEVVGRPARSFNVLYLRRAIVARLKARAEGLEPDARQRRTLARAVTAALEPPRPHSTGPAFRHHPRIPPIGTVLRRRHGEEDIEVLVLRDGFRFRGRHFTSLSAIACEVTRQHWNGALWFGLRPRQRGPRARRAP